MLLKRVFSIGLMLVPSVFLQTSHSLAAPAGGFAAVLDQSSSNTDSRRSVVFFDTADMTAPLFGVFVGEEAASSNTFEDPDSITVDPATGDVYVLAFDSGSPLDPVDTAPALDGQGDFDLYRIDFQSAYAHWEANFQGAGTGGSNVYATYGDGASSFDPSHTNPQGSPVVIDKIGEIARSPGNPTGGFFNSRLEFIDQQTLAYLDANLSTDGGTNDVQIRTIQQVSASSGSASFSGGSEGGFNNNTSESWESTIVGYVGLDGANTSDTVSIAAVRGIDGVTGLWILENDGNSDEVGFFEISNLNGTAGNAYRDINFSGGPDTRIDLANDPFIDPTTNDGNGDQVLVDPTTGDVVIVESGIFDPTTEQPAALKLLIDTYDNGFNQIDADFTNLATTEGFTPKQFVDVTGIYDDGPLAVIDGRNAIFDWVNNDVYFYDEDGASDTTSSGTAFVHDWYKLDLDTGVTTAVGPDADQAGLFSTGGRANDQVEFFYIVPEPATLAMVLFGLTHGLALRRRA